MGSGNPSRSAGEMTLNDFRSLGYLLRVAILGIGHELRGDDAAGAMVARALQERAGTEGWVDGSLHVWVVDAGSAPENYAGAVRRFRPDLVLLIDTAEMDEAPGTIRWLAWQDTSGLSASTHTLPPSIFAQYLIRECGCQVALIGIQPFDLSLGAPLSPAVQAAVDELVQALSRSLGLRDAR